jgi:hypothetical protein
VSNEEFLTKLSTEVDALAHESAVDSSQAFLLWFGQRALELEPDDAFAATRGEGGNDKGIDFSGLTMTLSASSLSRASILQPGFPTLKNTS